MIGDGIDERLGVRGRAAPGAPGRWHHRAFRQLSISGAATQPLWIVGVVINDGEVGKVLTDGRIVARNALDGDLVCLDLTG